jgi:serine/threonine protein kinase
MKNLFKIYSATRINEMEEIISSRIGKGGLTVEFCKEYGLREFDPSIYIELETLGEGAFGIVKKCMEIKNRELHAVKKMKIKGIKHSKMIDNLGSFLVEREVSRNLLSLKNPSIACFKDNFYILDQNQDIESVVLVSEAGDYSLRQLLECRKAQNKNPPYHPDEALRILIPIAKAYKAIQKHRIYHSDTKLDNIVYSDSLNKFIIIDFGVSNIINSSTESNSSPDEVEICYTVRGGTAGYDSPEKSKYLANPNENSEMIFNPFKCDMWALGVCLEMMCCGSDPDIKIDHPLFQRIRKGLKEIDWKNRFDATMLCDELQELENTLIKDDLDMGKIENEFLVILKKRTWDQKPELIQSYFNANMPQERLQIALYQMEAVERKHKGIVTELNWVEHDVVLMQLGWNIFEKNNITSLYLLFFFNPSS